MANVVRWSPFHELEALERRMRRMFDASDLPGGQAPAADLYETDDQFVLEMEVPGFKEDEMTIELSDRTVTVKGEREETREKKEKSFLLQERVEQSFERRFSLPDDADVDRLAATFKDGVLTISAPKAPGAPSRTVAISSG